jgi:hypothetical protein
MRYEDIRGQIKTGDVLGVRGHGAFPLLTTIVQRLGGLGNSSSITHVGVAWWVEGRLYSVEMDGRHNVLRPLSQHIADGCEVDVYACPVRETMPSEFDRATANPINYSVFDLVKIGMRLMFGSHTGRDNDADMVCSTFASRWLQRAGWPPPAGFPEMPSPGELCRALGRPEWTVMASTNELQS